MRNGLNISNVSEIVHELRQTPIEADVRYQAQVALRPDRFAGCILTTQAGTIRVPRDFRLEGERAGSIVAPGLPSALEYLQAALAGCVLVTYLYGGSAKGITLTSLAIEVVAEQRRGPAGEDVEGLRYILDVDADCDDAAVSGVARYVSFLSPNHRTVIEPNELALDVVVRGGDQELRHTLTVPADDPPVELPEVVDEIRCQLAWEYGTQLAGHVWSRARPDRRPIAVDQLKQYLGIDKAPNPQEYLLTALGMDIVAGLVAAAEPPSPLYRVEIALGGNLDLRGVLYVEPSAEVRVHRVGGTITLEVAGDPAPFVERVEQAVRRSAVRRVLCNPKSIEVEVRARGERLITFPSHQRLLKMYRRANKLPL
jgi:uncharacterized OsmC-like protein